MKEADLKVIEELIAELFSKLGISPKFSVKENGEDSLELNIDSPEEAGLLIGFRGENLGGLQTIIGLMIKNKLGKWYRLTVNIGDYNQKQEDKLKSLADQAAARALETGESQPIYNLNAQQRRIIHLYLSENKEVQTESVGEGLDRYLVVKPK